MKKIIAVSLTFLAVQAYASPAAFFDGTNLIKNIDGAVPANAMGVRYGTANPKVPAPLNVVQDKNDEGLGKALAELYKGIFDLRTQIRKQKADNAVLEQRLKNAVSNARSYYRDSPKDQEIIEAGQLLVEEVESGTRKKDHFTGTDSSHYRVGLVSLDILRGRNELQNLDMDLSQANDMLRTLLEVLKNRGK